MVQIQKEEMRAALLMEAKKEFISNGYKLASMRRISKAANTTIGNVYKYFTSKEDLYEQLVLKVKEKIFHYIEEKGDLDREVPADKHFDLMAFAELMSENRDEMLLLTDGSSGTKYENVKEQMLNMISNNIHLYLTVVFKEGNNIACPPEVLARSIAVGLLEGLLDVLRQHTDKGEIRSAVECFIYFMFKNYIK